jgi:bacterioferritin
MNCAGVRPPRTCSAACGEETGERDFMAALCPRAVGASRERRFLPHGGVRHSNRREARPGGKMALDKKKVIKQLNKILECELAGVVRYTHYSMMIFGYSRIPIVSWFTAEATESLQHAQQAGEMVTRLGGHPSLGIGDLLETHQHDIGQILRETLEAEHNALKLYTDLLKLVERKSVALEEYARDLIAQEEAHIDEIDKMLRKPGETTISKEARDLD